MLIKYIKHKLPNNGFTELIDLI